MFLLCLLMTFSKFSTILEELNFRRLPWWSPLCLTLSLVSHYSWDNDPSPLHGLLVPSPEVSPVSLPSFLFLFVHSHPSIYSYSYKLSSPPPEPFAHELPHVRKLFPLVPHFLIHVSVQTSLLRESFLWPSYSTSDNYVISSHKLYILFFQSMCLHFSL